MAQGFYIVLNAEDNLSSISERFGIKQDSLKLWNEIEDPTTDVQLGGKIVLQNPKLNQ